MYSIVIISFPRLKICIQVYICSKCFDTKHKRRKRGVLTMNNDFRFPNAKHFFSWLTWLSIIALLAVIVLNFIVYSTFKSFNHFTLAFEFHQTELIFLITFSIIAIISIIMYLILKLFKHS